jgi:hypothetical protein
MKRFALALAVLLSGCIQVPTMFEKSISIEKDAEGKVLKVITTERLLQHVKGYGELQPEILPKPKPSKPMDYNTGGG